MCPLPTVLIAAGRVPGDMSQCPRLLPPCGGISATVGGRSAAMGGWGWVGVVIFRADPMCPLVEGHGLARINGAGLGGGAQASSSARWP
jgi:hypothetical protein